MNIGNVMDLGANPATKTEKPFGSSRNAGTFKEDILRFSEKLSKPGDNTASRQAAHRKKSAHGDAAKQALTSKEKNTLSETETDEPESAADAAVSAFMPWSVSNTMASDGQNPESALVETQQTINNAVGKMLVQTAHDAQNSVFPLQEAAENASLPQEKFIDPAKETAAFVDQLIGEIKQSVARNEAERTVPVQMQETDTQEAQCITLQDPTATEAPEDETAQENDYYIAAEAAAQHSEADLQAASEKEPDTDKGTQTPIQTANTKKSNGQISAAIMPFDVPVMEAISTEGTIPPRELNEGFLDTLTEHLMSAVTNGQDELYIQLKPAVLGGLSVRLLMTDEGLHAQVRTSNQSLQAVMNAELSQLADTLRNKGIQVAHMECIYDFMTGNEQFAGRQQHFQDDRNDTQKSRRPYAVEGVSSQPLVSYENMVPTETMEQEGIEFSA